MAGYAPYLGGQAVASMIDNAMQYGMTRSMMQYQNDYNSPVNQVNRLKAAGLSSWNINPSGNTSAQPVVMPSNISGAVGSEADRRLSARQLDIQENLSSAQAERERSQSSVNQTLAETNRMLLKYLPQSEEQRIRSMKTGSDYTEKQLSRYDENVQSTLDLNKAQETLAYANSEAAKASTNRINRMLQYEIKEAKSRILFNTQQVAYLKTQAKLSDNQIQQIGVMISKIRADTRNTSLQSWFLQHQKEVQKELGVRPGSPAWTAISDFFANALYERMQQ